LHVKNLHFCSFNSHVSWIIMINVMINAHQAPNPWDPMGHLGSRFRLILPQAFGQRANPRMWQWDDVFNIRMYTYTYHKLYMYILEYV
jgi:hypothetical protein